MSDAGSGRPGLRPETVAFLLLGLVLLSTGRSLGNGFAFDDVPMIVENAQIHAVSSPWVYAQQSYWPPKNLGDAYRPWTIWMFALQWAIGGGSALPFHLVSLALTAAVTILVFLLARRLLPPLGALAAAALFAVHPVHVEATGNVVGQAELWMSGFVLAAVLLYASVRLGPQRSRVPGVGVRLGLAGLLVLAASAKEQGVVLPVLLGCFELLFVRPEPGERRRRTVGPLFGFLAIVLVGFLAARYAVLGDLGGGPPAAGIEGLGVGARALVMLPLFVDWARLLVWPQSLLAQYSPPAHGGAVVWSGAAVLGLGLVAVAIGGLVATARRAPVAAFGIGWIAITGFLVSNLVVPTGILIAERTLFLPSVGIALLGGALVGAATGRGGAAAVLALGTAGLAIALGAARSFSRQAVWRDSLTLFRQSIADEPRSYRTWRVYGAELVRHNRLQAAADAFAHAADLYDGDNRVFEEWGQAYRRMERYDEAAVVLRRGLARHPDASLLRTRLFEVLYAAHKYDEAEAVALEGIGRGADEFKLSLDRVRRARTS